MKRPSSKLSERLLVATLAATAPACGPDTSADNPQLGVYGGGGRTFDRATQCTVDTLFVDLDGFEDTCENLEGVGIFDLREECPEGTPGSTLVQVSGIVEGPYARTSEQVQDLREAYRCALTLMGREVVFEEPSSGDFDVLRVGLRSRADRVRRAGTRIEVDFAKGNANVRTSQRERSRRVLMHVGEGVLYDTNTGTNLISCKPEEMFSVSVHEAGHGEDLDHTTKVMATTVGNACSNSGTFNDVDANHLAKRMLDCGDEELQNPSVFKKRVKDLKKLAASCADACSNILRW